MAGRNALSVELIKPTGDQAIVSSYFIQLPRNINGRVHKDTSHAHLVLDLTVFQSFYCNYTLYKADTSPKF